MGNHPNVELAKRLLEAFNDGDAEAASSLLAEDIVWHQIGGRTVNGLKELADEMTISSDFGLSIHGDLHDVVGNDDHVVALVEATAKAGGEEFKYRTAEIMHVADGKVTERWAFSDDTQAIVDYFKQFES